MTANKFYLRMALDPDQARQFVGPDLSTNCLCVKLSADDTSRQRLEIGAVLTLKAQITTAADDKFSYIFPNFRKK